MNDNPSKCAYCGTTKDLHMVSGLMMCGHCAGHDETYCVWVKPKGEAWYIEAMGLKRDMEAIAAEMQSKGDTAQVEVYEAG